MGRDLPPPEDRASWQFGLLLTTMSKGQKSVTLKRQELVCTAGKPASSIHLLFGTFVISSQGMLAFLCRLQWEVREAGKAIFFSSCS